MDVSETTAPEIRQQRSKNHPADGRRHKTHSAAFYLHRLWVSVGLCGYFVFLCDHFESPRGYFKFLGVFFILLGILEKLCGRFVSLWLFLSVYDPFESLPGRFVFLCCTECV